jgi:O-antigen/teichoic acid export membrane protein
VSSGALTVRARRHTRAALRDGLVRNSFLLMANLVLGASVGFVFTLLAARLYAPSELGVSTSALSAVTLVTNLSGLGLGYSLVRMLPTAQDPDRMLDTALATLLVAVPSVLGVFLLVPAASGELIRVGDSGVIVALLVGTVVGAIQGTFETAFVAHRRPAAILAANGVAGALRLALLFVLLPVGALGPFWAQTAALGCSLAILAVVLTRHRGRSPRLAVHRRSVSELWRFSAGQYVANLIGGLPAMTIPLVVLSQLGRSAVAYWYVAYSMASLFFTLPGVVSRSLLAEGASAERGRLRLLAKGAGLIAAVMLPVLTVAWVAAPLVLRLYGGSYVDGATTVLRYLLVSGVLVSANYVLGTVLFLATRVAVAAVVNAANAAVVLTFILWRGHGLDDVGLAWLLGEVVNVAGFGLAALLVLRRHWGEWSRGATG